jgi:hypothetical protein
MSPLNKRVISSQVGKGRRSRPQQVDHRMGEKPVVELSVNAQDEIWSQMSDILEDSPRGQASSAGNDDKTLADCSMSLSSLQKFNMCRASRV